MPIPRTAPRTSAVAAALTATGAALLVLAPSPTGLDDTLAAVRDGSVTPDTGLVAVLAALGWLCLGWLVAGAALSAAAHVPGGLGRLCDTLARRVAPAVLRRTVEAALGVSLVAGVVGTGPAYADAPVPLESPSPVLGDVGPFDRPVTASKAARPGHRPAPSASPTSSAVPTAAKPTPPLSAVVSVVPGNGSFLVEVPRPTTSVPVDRPADSPGLRAQRPTADPTLLSGPAAPAAPADAGVAVVQRGDTLWGLAARQLGPHATPADIDAQWRRWYAANRAVIGTDPDVIRPGQRLHAPSAPISRSAR